MLSDLRIAVVQRVSILLLISNFPIFLLRCSMRNTHNWYHYYLHVQKFFQFSCKVNVFFYHFAFFQFHSVAHRKRKIHYIFFLFITLSGLLAWTRWSVCIWKSQRILLVSLDKLLLVYILFLVWSNVKFLHDSLWITCPTRSRIGFYCFCASFLHSLIIWLIVSSS